MNHTQPNPELDRLKQYGNKVESLHPQLKTFYCKVVLQKMNKSSEPVITPLEFDTIKLKFPEAFFTNQKGEVEVKALFQMPDKYFIK